MSVSNPLSSPPFTFFNYCIFHLLFVWFFVTVFNSLPNPPNCYSFQLFENLFIIVWIFCGSFSNFSFSPWFWLFIVSLNVFLFFTESQKLSMKNIGRYFEALDDCSINLKYLHMIFISSFRRINVGEERIGKSQLVELSCVLGLIEKELREKGKKKWRPQSVWKQLGRVGGWLQRRDIRP